MSWRFLRNVLLKALGLLLILNFLMVSCNLDGFGSLSLYNRVVPGRERLPFGENSQAAYNLSLYNLPAMLASHRISVGKAANEFRVVIVGDSSMWGSLLKPQETLAGQLNAAGLTTCRRETVKFYNLGYPTLSLTKDLLILNAIRGYQPDLVIWAVTLESFPLISQLDSPLAAHNPAAVRALIQADHLTLDPNDQRFVDPSGLDRTWIGRRRELADLLRLQLYGAMWAATGIDQAYSNDYSPAQRDFKVDDNRFHGSVPPTLDQASLGFDLISAGMKISAPAKVVLVNEPILVSNGKNSQIRYNFYYPRWAYDQYRTQLASSANQNGWTYLDAWSLVPENEFTNSAIHMSPAGTSLLSGAVQNAIRGELCR